MKGSRRIANMPGGRHCLNTAAVTGKILKQSRSIAPKPYGGKGFLSMAGDCGAVACHGKKRRAVLFRQYSAIEMQGFFADFFGVKTQGACFKGFCHLHGDARPVEHVHKSEIFFFNHIRSVHTSVQAERKNL